MTEAIRQLRTVFTGYARYLGQIVLLLSEVFRAVAKGRIRRRELLTQIVQIGFATQFVVMVTGAFTGVVFAAQAFFKFSEIGLESATGPLVWVAMTRELGPVLAGIMVAARIGASMAAEIGAMRVSEQLDALRSMGVSPAEYLVVPRMIAILISMPVLVAESILLGVFAAEFFVVDILDLPRVWFRSQISAYASIGDVITGFVKGVVFGLLIAVISCRSGLETETGAAAVGKSTMRAVVESALAILISNLFLTLLLNQLLPMIPVGR